MTSSGTAKVQAHPLSIRAALEGLGSFFIIFAGLGAAMFNSSGSASTVGFAYGLAMIAALISFGHISRGYFNPAFSVGLAVAGKLKFTDMIAYVVAQTVGGMLAAALWLATMRVMPSGAIPDMAKFFGALSNGFDSHSPSQLPMVGVMIVEIVATGMLMAILLGVASPRKVSPVGPVAVGLAFAVAVSITMPLSNGSLNPARSSAVVLLAESWALGQVWLFWLAPLVGAALAGALYRSFAPAVSTETETEIETETVDAGTASVPAVTSVSAAATASASTASASATVLESADDEAGNGKSSGDDAQAFFDGK